jgi:hypothetical protein
MKKLLYIFAFAFVVACSSDDDTPDATIAITELEATGTVAEQTVAEAKKTIFGRWDIASSSSKSVSIGKSSSCAFDFIEFTDDDYIMGLTVGGEDITVFGSYDMNDDASGNVENVTLNFDLGTSEVTIATLTNIVVVESGNNLNASFDVVLSIPDDNGFAICNGLTGDYSASKDEPMDASSSATADTNHAKIVKTWTLSSFVEADGRDVVDEIKMDPCYVYSYNEATGEEYADLDPTCTPASSIVVSFSTFGTYSFVLVGSSDGTMAETNDWSWADASQTTFYVDGGDERQLVTINTLTDNSLVVTDEEGATLTFTR